MNSVAISPAAPLEREMHNVADQARLQLAREAYRSDEARLFKRDLSGMTHLVATRKGLLAVNESEWRLVAYGSFFGMVVHSDFILAFEACGEPRDTTPMGRIVRLARQGDHITGCRVIARGLDNGCHGMDLFDDRLHVMDTYNQRILRFNGDKGLERLDGETETLYPLPQGAQGRWKQTDPLYRHANCILRVNGCNLLLLHNNSKHTGRGSELDVYDDQWKRRVRLSLPGSNCHGLSVLEDGTVLTCDSTAGDIVTLAGKRTHVSDLFARGLAVGPDSIAVGGSPFARRGQRNSTDGIVTLMRRDYSIRTVLDVPGAPTEIRRLDGNDYGQAGDLCRQTGTRKLIGVTWT